jgi:hypothetical protein
MAHRLEAAAMIPRHQRILLWTLLLASVVMAIVLIRLRERAADHLAGMDQSTSAEQLAISSATGAAESVTLLEANDTDGALAPVTRQIALPKEPGARARVLLRQLFADFAAADSKHPLAPGPGVEEVFFMPAGANKSVSAAGHTGAQLAVINLTRAFAENHPSGIEPETLTLLSIIGTLHENFPEVGQVRFLVDGQPRLTLAGHADLTRVYLASQSESRP